MQAEDFPRFYTAVHGYPPFPWQARLAQAVLAGDWPTTLALPTASGKTSIVDIFTFALALQATRPAADRTVPLRLVFVVDRRLVVDEAFQHATHLARALADGAHGTTHDSVRDVARQLRHFGGSTPLAVTQLRGGMYRDDSWTLAPNQPLILVSTVDQVGSRLLFRGYGVSPYQWPVQAGLLGNDCLYVLDEAHLSQPFLDTLTRVATTYRGWADRPLQTPFRLLEMSATPRQPAQVFQLGPDDYHHPVLRARLTAAKLARLLDAPEERFTATVLDQARQLAHGEAVHVIGVVVNRVDTARAVFEALRCEAEAVLLTGRIRPYDREQLLAAYVSRIRAGQARPGEGLLYVVATQTIEVGANIDFDALVTEAAPLAALRQRFGRLDRLGQRGQSEAVIVLRHTPDDPIYGGRAAATFRWLRSQATGRGAHAVVDFGIQALAHPLDNAVGALPAPPVEAAPVLLPALLEQWVQTSPIPHPDPTIAPFLHGTSASAADVQVVWRADVPDDPRLWADTVALMPPRLREALPAPLSAVQAWLRQQDVPSISDLEGTETGALPSRDPSRQVLRWHGEESTLVSAHELRPGDTIVVPALWGGSDACGWHPASTVPVVDIAEACQPGETGRRVQVRAHPALLAQWLEAEEAAQVHGTLVALCQALTAPERYDADRPRLALATQLSALCGRFGWRGAPERLHVLPYPGAPLRGVVLTTGGLATVTDDDDTASCTRPVALTQHLEGVGAWARRFATQCGLSATLVADVSLAGRLHDLGKGDRRFQCMLHGGEELAALRAPALLAKSGLDPTHRAAFRLAWRRSTLPRGWRHECFSVALLASNPAVGEQAHDADLVRYLVGVHHGLGRPFPPAVVDRHPQESTVHYRDWTFTARSDHGLERLDSGWAALFWQLVRRYGYWGLAYLEALVRMADRARSSEEMAHA